MNNTDVLKFPYHTLLKMTTCILNKCISRLSSLYTLPPDVSVVIYDFANFHVANGNLAWERQCSEILVKTNCQMFHEHLLEYDRLTRLLLLYHITKDKVELKLQKKMNKPIADFFLFGDCFLIKYGADDAGFHNPQHNRMDDHEAPSLLLVDFNGVIIKDWTVFCHKIDYLEYYYIIEAHAVCAGGDIFLLIEFESSNDVRHGVQLQKFSNKGEFISSFDCVGLGGRGEPIGFCVDFESNAFVYSHKTEGGKCVGIFIDKYDCQGVMKDRFLLTTPNDIKSITCLSDGSFLIASDDFCSTGQMKTTDGNGNNDDDDDDKVKFVIRKYTIRSQQCEFERLIYECPLGLTYNIERNGNIRVVELTNPPRIRCFC